MTINMGTVWDRTTQFLTGTRRALTPIVLIAIFVPQLVTELAGQAHAALGDMPAQGLGLAGTVAGIWGQLAVVALALDPDAGRGAAQRAATRAFVPALLLMLLLFVAFAVLAVPIVATLVAAGADLSLFGRGAAVTPGSLNLSTGAGVFLTLYSLAVAIVVLVLSVRIIPLYPVLIAEGRGIGAIGRAIRVSRGIAWKLAGVWILFLVVFAVAAGAARTVFGSITALIASDGGGFGAVAIVTAIAGAVVGTIFSLIVAAFSAKVYRAVTAGATA